MVWLSFLHYTSLCISCDNNLGKFLMLCFVLWALCCSFLSINIYVCTWVDLLFVNIWMYWFVNGWRAWYSQNLCEYKDFVESVFWCSHIFKDGIKCNYDIFSPCKMNNLYILYNNYVFNHLIIFQLSLDYAQLSLKYICHHLIIHTCCF
jgi:hypothetical protein